MAADFSEHLKQLLKTPAYNFKINIIKDISNIKEKCLTVEHQFQIIQIQEHI